MKTQDILIAHPQTEKETSALKAVMDALKIEFETSERSLYSEEFVAKILTSRRQAQAGKTAQMELSDIWPA
ncbi:MAG: DUF2683 family protein [Bacteroidota bacterium]